MICLPASGQREQAERAESQDRRLGHSAGGNRRQSDLSERLSSVGREIESIFRREVVGALIAERRSDHDHVVVDSMNEKNFDDALL